MNYIKIRQNEFNDLYNISDLLPFYKIKKFWNKINITFFEPIYKSEFLINFNYYAFYINNFLSKFIQRFFPK